MRLRFHFAAGTLLTALLLSTAEPGAAQRRRAKKSSTIAAPAGSSTTEARPESVVMLPEGARPRVDTALLNPEPQPRRRRFDVKVVPAAPPGRSRQEIMYTDSIANRSPRR